MPYTSTSARTARHGGLDPLRVPSHLSAQQVPVQQAGSMHVDVHQLLPLLGLHAKGMQCMGAPAHAQGPAQLQPKQLTWAPPPVNHCGDTPRAPALPAPGAISAVNPKEGPDAADSAAASATHQDPKSVEDAAHEVLKRLRDNRAGAQRTSDKGSNASAQTSQQKPKQRANAKPKVCGKAAGAAKNAKGVPQLQAKHRRGRLEHG